MKLIDKIENILNLFLKALVILFLAFMSISVFYAVVSRYVFRSAPFWVEEVARFLMVYMAFFGSAIAFRARSHVGFSFIIDNLIPMRLRPYIILATDILTAIFFGFVIYHGVRFANQGIGIVSPATGINMAFVYSGVFIGSSFCLIQVLITMLRDVRDHIILKKDADPSSDACF